MSGIYDLTLSASASAAQQIPAMGSYVKVISAPAGPVRVRLDGGDAYQFAAGQGLRMRDGETFRDVQVNNAAGAAQGVLIFIGDDRVEDSTITGDVAIVDQVRDSTQTDSNFNTAITGFTATAIVAAATNTKGVIVRAINVQSKGGAGGSSLVMIMAAPTAPTGIAGTQRIILAVAQDTTGAAIVVQTQTDLKKRIPAGWGIWYCRLVSVAVAAANSYDISFDVLT